MIAARSAVRPLTRSFSTLSILEEFPNIPRTSPSSKSVSPVQSSTTANGLTIITDSSAMSSAVAITYPAGTSSETAATRGASAAHKYMSFKSMYSAPKDEETVDSSASVIYQIESNGATVFTDYGRTSSTKGYVTSPEYATDMLQFLAAAPAFYPWDCRDSVKAAQVEAAAYAKCPEATLRNSLYAAAYGPNSAMGASALYPAFGGVTEEGMRAFYAATRMYNGATITATGIADHDAFVKAVNEHFIGEKIERSVAPGGGYTGGDSRIEVASPFANVAIGLKGPECASTALVMRAALDSILPSGSAFVADDIVGVTARGTGGEAAAHVVDGLCKTLEGLAGADASVVEAAKTKCMLDNADALNSGSIAYSASLRAGLDFSKVDAASVKKAASAMLKESVSIGSVGDISGVPTYSVLCKRFG